MKFLGDYLTPCTVPVNGLKAHLEKQNKTKQSKRKSAERITDRYRPCQNRPADPGTTEVEAPRKVTDLHPSSRTVGAKQARSTYDAACKADHQPTDQS